MSRYFSAKGLVVIAALLITSVLFLASFPWHGLQSHGYQTTSFNQMQNIAQAIALHANNNNGNLPRSLGDLFPKYMKSPEYFLFKSPYSNSVMVGDSLDHKELIDTFSPYSFMKLPDNRIVVVERPGFWKDGKITYCLLGKDGKPIGDSSSCHVTPEEFIRRFIKGFPDLQSTSAATGTEH